jgi:hypothetical protein
MKKFTWVFICIAILSIEQNLIASAFKEFNSSSPGKTGSALFVSYITSKGDSNIVYVEFSESLNKSIAETKSNYSISNGITITDARLPSTLAGQYFIKVYTDAGIFKQSMIIR